VSELIVSVSGVRGIVGETLTMPIAEDFGRAFATMLGAGKTVVLGRDSRPSGADFARAITAGLNGGGVNVVELGIVTTPGAALMIKRLGADGGVVITASHNPAPYNGIKFMSPAGVNLPAAQAARLKDIWRNRRFTPADRPGAVAQNGDTHRLHIQAVLAILDIDAIKRRKCTVVLDSINGAGCVPTARLLEQLGCRLIHVNGTPTGDFPHEPEPIVKNLTGLCDEVRRHKADIGFAQDPDADRLVIVDENGVFIGEEYTLALTAAFVLSQRKGDLAANLSTSRMIDDLAGRAGVTMFRTPVGEANVADRMTKEGCLFGGEGNGGVMDPRVVLVRDSLVGIGLMLNYLAAAGKTVSQLVADMPRYAMLKDKFPCPLAQAPAVVAKVKAALAARPGAKLNEEDGLRVDLPEGWVQIRASNTEPIMRIMAEAASAPAAQALADEVRRIADAAMHAIP
jgi:phosphomannomutase